MGKTAAELRTEIADHREEIGGTLETIGDRVSPGRVVERQKEQVRNRVRGVRTAVMGDPDEPEDGGATGAAVDRATGAKDRAAEAVSSGAERTAELTQAAADQTRQRVQGTPLLAGAVAFGIGAMIGSALPGTRAEKDAVASAGSSLGDAAGQARELARGVADDLREPVQQAVEHVKDEATDAAGRLAEEGQTARDQVADAASGGGAS